MWSLSNSFTSAFKELNPIPQFKPTAKLGEFVEAGFYNRSNRRGGITRRPPLQLAITFCIDDPVRARLGKTWNWVLRTF